MKTKFIYLILLSLHLLYVSKSSASHVAGGSLTYQYLGGNNYFVSYTLYRDCSSISAPVSAILTAYSSTCGSSNFTLLPAAGTGQEVVNYCPSVVSYCNGGTAFGIQEWVYSGQITLPLQCNDWSLFCSETTHNTVTNLVNSGSIPFTTSSPLDNSGANADNTPVFNAAPVAAICTGQTDIDLSATDPDGDSLAYSLVDAFNGQASYITGCSYLQPFIASQPATFNQQTGQFTVYPNQGQSTVYMVRVSEYRSGVLIGSVTREIACFVYPCINSIPSLSGINGTTLYTDTLPANTATCFNLYSSDSDSAQTIQLNWDTSITNAIFTGDTSRNQIGTFCWTPLLSDTSGNPHCFHVTVEDDNCALAGSHSYTHCIIVVDSGYLLETNETSKEKDPISIFPNPFHSSALLHVSSAFEKAVLTIYDTHGAIVSTQRISNKNNLTLNRELLSNGIYFLQLSNDKGLIITRKFMIE